MITTNGIALGSTAKIDKKALSIKLDRHDLKKEVEVPTDCLIIPRTEVKYFTEDNGYSPLGIYAQACLSCQARTRVVEACTAFFLPECLKV